MSNLWPNDLAVNLTLKALWNTAGKPCSKKTNRIGVTRTIQDCACCETNWKTILPRVSPGNWETWRRVGDALQQRYLHCLSFLLFFFTGMIYLWCELACGSLCDWYIFHFVVCFLVQTSELLKQTHAHPSIPPLPSPKRGLIAAGAKRVADVWRRFGGALLFLRLLLRQQPIPYYSRANRCGEWQPWERLQRQLETNRQNGGHFGYVGATRVPDSHLDGLRTVCGFHHWDRGQELARVNCSPFYAVLKSSEFWLKQ